ncbi:MAG: divergent polysaccharide deacetylase family protein [Candidatus Hydrogenedentes bacterium]|nr:divergent polysaccharide deacetylase family protein [Candidatus Hydrogenedentota bacterium]
MANDQSTPATDAAVPQNPTVNVLPNPWSSVWIGLGAVVAGAVLCFLLAIWFLGTRPISLEAQTRNLVEALDDLFLVNRVPESQIRWDAPELRQQENTRWQQYQCEVTLPETLSIGGVQKLIQKDMTQRNVMVAIEAQETYEPLLKLSFYGHEFAHVRLRGGTPGSAVAPASPAESQPALPAVQLAELPPQPTPAVAAGPPPPLEELPLESSGIEEAEVTPLSRPAAVDVVAPRVAIIVDDGGYGGDVTDQILSLDSALTLSILPHTPAAEDTARRAAELGFEVMLHMPMQPSLSGSLFPGEITITMNEVEIRALAANALAQVPGAVGVNNHQGSEFTRNEPAMRFFLAVVKEHSLFFVDSLTTAESVACTLARELEIPCTVRDVFLDHQNNPEYIRERFDTLVERSRVHGRAIAICHFRPITATLLAELLPRLAQEEVELVHVSELVE